MSGINIPGSLLHFAQLAQIEGIVEDVIETSGITTSGGGGSVNISGQPNQIVISGSTEYPVISIAPSANGYGIRYVSTESPSGFAGGSNGDMWLQLGEDTDISLFQTDNITGGSTTLAGHLNVIINGVPYKLALVAG